MRSGRDRTGPNGGSLTHRGSRVAQLCGLSRRKTADLLNLLEEAGAVTVEGPRRAVRALPGRTANEAA